MSNNDNNQNPQTTNPKDNLTLKQVYHKIFAVANDIQGLCYQHSLNATPQILNTDPSNTFQHQQQVPYHNQMTTNQFTGLTRTNIESQQLIANLQSHVSFEIKLMLFTNFINCELLYYYVFL